jgi:YHS domain-containing protein
MALSSETGGKPIMAKDIVCGTEIDEQRTARKSEYRGRIYYFCSLGCQQRFGEEPARYADPRAAHEDATHQLTVQPGEGGPCVR